MGTVAFTDFYSHILTGVLLYILKITEKYQTKDVCELC